MNSNPVKAFHLMAKPVGPACNLKCEYCFYLEKQALYKATKRYRMSKQVLEQYIKKYITGQDAPEISFVWQGGEPLLAGIDFYKDVTRIQNKYAEGKKVTNSIQTNGTLLDQNWCIFLDENNFLVGLSIDGPEEIHDRYRVDRKGKPTFKSVFKGMKMLQKYCVEFNVLACVTAKSAKQPLAVYRFFKEQGVKFIQFIPVVERGADEKAKKLGLSLATPLLDNGSREAKGVTSWSVGPEEYGEFLIQVFDEWVRKDVGKVFVMNFENALGAWIGLDSPTCAFARICGQNMIIEHNGDIYSCDHYVYPANYLGNIMPDEPGGLLRSLKQQHFGNIKEEALPAECLNCRFLSACRGECPKHRFLKTGTGQEGLNYLCKGYQKYFKHIDKYMKVMAYLLSNGYPVERVMDAIDSPLVILP